MDYKQNAKIEQVRRHWRRCSIFFGKLKQAKSRIINNDGYNCEARVAKSRLRVKEFRK